jgi:hypothetical protein
MRHHRKTDRPSHSTCSAAFHPLKTLTVLTGSHRSTVQCQTGGYQNLSEGQLDVALGMSGPEHEGTTIFEAST